VLGAKPTLSIGCELIFACYCLTAAAGREIELRRKRSRLTQYENGFAAGGERWVNSVGAGGMTFKPDGSNREDYPDSQRG
jgi:hypothetical protein